MSLYGLIARNERLQYLDAITGERYALHDLNDTLDITDKQALAFLYLDNSIASIKVLLNCLNSKLTLALLSPKLNIEYKQQLEQVYSPYYIYDVTRDEIPDFDLQKSKLFRHRKGIRNDIHPDIKVLLSTSGTTGSPKFVKLSEDNLVQNALSILDYLPVNNSDVTPLNLPVFYSYGLSVFTTNSIAGGQIVCGNRDVVQKEFWEDMERYGYTSIAGVPYVYEMLHRIGFCRKEYASLRYMTQAGGKLNASLIKSFGEYMTDRNKQFFVMYGQTEATARMAYMPPHDLLKKTGSIGMPVKGGQFTLAPDTNELLYSGPNVFGGYATSAADLATFEYLPMLHTGDVASRDADGYYYITGRLKRFVKLFGTRINLDEVETILKQEMQGETFACVGIEDKHLLVFHKQAALDDNDIRSLLVKKLGLHPTAFKVQKVDDFALTPNGKLDYTAMQQNNMLQVQN
ncbi:AMP-binding protein [Chitinophaga sp. S165]|uniref:AMP-binding protein n=1 Tax=Chitinophaga sp. S165 TaxID=2135462 RepID=UPI000D71C767|nr:AMP-binding protein [Chitinophaga sp. S165]PWV54342.1 acyl-CoA synthetase (AMP-forming)/AMP-acid ligase II [Chitinophaga sp. S165]